MLLVVATSSGSSPGRPGYKMGVAESGELIGSIGGGVMEVNLIEQSRAVLGAQAALPASSQGEMIPAISDQVHRKDVPNSSGMICSGKQTIIFKLLTPDDIESVNMALSGVQDRNGSVLALTQESFDVMPPIGRTRNDIDFTRRSDSD